MKQCLFKSNKIYLIKNSKKLLNTYRANMDETDHVIDISNIRMTYFSKPGKTQSEQPVRESQNWNNIIKLQDKLK